MPHPSLTLTVLRWCVPCPVGRSDRDPKALGGQDASEGRLDTSRIQKLMDASPSGVAPAVASKSISVSVEAIRHHVVEALFCARARREALETELDAHREGMVIGAATQRRRARMNERSQLAHALKAAELCRELVIVACGDLILTPDISQEAMDINELFTVCEVIGTAGRGA